MKNVCLLGATGSIGQQVLDLIRLDKEFKLAAFSYGINYELAKKIIREFKPLFVSCQKEEDYDKLKQEFPDLSLGYGLEGLINVATFEIDNPYVVNALVGSVGLKPTYEAILKNRNIYLANKETLVIGGKIIMEQAHKHQVKIIPLDSEHSAIYQLLDENNKKEVKRLILTASGGALRDYSLQDLKHVTIKEVLNHPNWQMGKKITVDCATMMNKGFEVIEASYLFNIPVQAIDVIVHYESVIHSMVEFNDYSICAQMASPDMHLPLNYALSTKSHRKCDIIKPLNLKELSILHFKELDNERYPLVKLAKEVLVKGGFYPCIMNATNEAAVALFLNEVISFTMIEKIIKEEITSSFYETIHKLPLTIDNLIMVDNLVKQQVNKKIKEG